MSFWAISSFLGGFEIFVAAFIRRSQGWTERFRTSRAARPFSRQNSNPRLDFPFRRKEGKFFFLLVWSAWKKLHPFRSNSNDLCITTGAFSFPEHLVAVFSTTAQLEIKLCNRSSVTTATDRTGAQSKFPIKNLTLSPRPHGSILTPLCNTNRVTDKAKTGKSNSKTVYLCSEIVCNLLFMQWIHIIFCLNGH